MQSRRPSFPTSVRNRKPISKLCLCSAVWAWKNPTHHFGMFYHSFLLLLSLMLIVDFCSCYWQKLVTHFDKNSTHLERIYQKEKRRTVGFFSFLMVLEQLWIHSEQKLTGLVLGEAFKRAFETPFVGYRYGFGFTIHWTFKGSDLSQHREWVFKGIVWTNCLSSHNFAFRHIMRAGSLLLFQYCSILLSVLCGLLWTV